MNLLRIALWGFFIYFILFIIIDCQIIRQTDNREVTGEERNGFLNHQGTKSASSQPHYIQHFTMKVLSSYCEKHAGSDELINSIFITILSCQNTMNR